ncbi:MAG: translation initiation factor IF-2 [Acidobacteria bacterium]|nr:translation initiation factor IF-2 [Acidobacteriota bacterium]
MGNIKVHELAKELNISSDQILERCKSLNIDVTSDQSTIEENDLIKLKAFLKVSMSTSAPIQKKKKQPAKAKEESKPAPPAKKKTVSKKKTAKKKPVMPKEEEVEEETPIVEEKAEVKKPIPKEKPVKEKEVVTKDTHKPAKEKPVADEKFEDTEYREKDAGESRKKAKKKHRDEDEIEEKVLVERDPSKPEPKRRAKVSAAATKLKIPGQEEDSFFKIEEDDHSGRDRAGDRNTSLPTAADIIEQQEQRPRMLKVKKVKRKKVVPQVEEEPQPEVKTASKRKKITSDPTADKDQIVLLSEGVTVKELAEKLGMRVKDIIKKLMELGYFFNLNQVLDKELAMQISEDLGYVAEIISFEEEMSIQVEETHEPEILERAPVVTVMGHVDHGKTSLMDVIRKANVAESEHGGITQHIGAYTVTYNNRPVVFLDTPGHEAFTKMRARGAQVTDIVILVVAADDGIKQQTIEAIDHAKAGSVPIIVAINKIDKPEANIERVKQQLSEHDLIPEDWGGKTVVCEVSAKQKIGIENLMEMIFLTSDMLELKADIQRMGRGYIIEAKKDPGRGIVATVLLLDGTLNIGDTFIAGATSGRIRAMMDDKGNRLEKAIATMPLEVQGFQDMPAAGDKFQIVEEEVQARKIQAFRQQKQREESLVRPGRITLEKLFDKISEGDIKELSIVIKADVQGSAEVLASSLAELSTDEVAIRILRNSVGGISDNDVILAAASNAIIIGFNIRPRPSAVKLAKKEGVDIRLHTVIYEVINEVRQAMERKLEPVIEEQFKGRAEVRDLFRLPKGKVIAGSFVIEGTITRKNRVRLIRDDVIIYTGKFASLRRFKDDVSEVKTNFECGIGLEDFHDIKVGDIIEAFEQVKVAAKLQ